MYLVPNIHPGSGSAGVPTVQANFAGSPADWTTLDTVSSMPSGGSMSRAGNAMLYDSTGKLTYAPNNLLLQSNDFTSGTWNKYSSTVPATLYSAPDGTTTAYNLQLGAVAAAYVAQNLGTLVTVPGVTYIFSVWLKSASGSPISNVKLSASVVGDVAVSITNTWARFSLSFTANTTTSNIYILTRDAVAANIYAWGAQVEAVTYQTSPSGTYYNNYPTPNTTSAYYGPRFDYDPSTLAAKGLLIEGTRTNLVLQSSALTNAAWTAYQAAFTTDTTLDPTGVAAQKLTATSGTTRQPQVYSTATVAITSGSQYTLSCYVKAGTLNYAAITLYGNVTGHWVSAVFDLSTSATTTASQTAVGGTSGTLYSTFKQNVGNGWYRVGITCSVAQSAAMTIIELAPAATGNTFAVASGSINFGTAAGTENIYISAPQLELGAFATSYIPTVASSVTRAAETFAITGYSSNLINATYIDEQTGVTSMQPYNAGVAPSPSFSWLTALRVYTNAYAGSIASPSWLSFSRTGNAMMTDSTGKLTWAPSNMLAYSQDQTQTSKWTTSNVTVADGGVAGPIGSGNAIRQSETATTNFHFVSQTFSSANGVTYIASAYMKQGTANYGGIHIHDGLIARGCSIDLSTGTLGTPYGGATASVKSVGSGWYQVVIIATAGNTSAGATFVIYNSNSNALASYAGNTANNILYFASQLEAVTYETSPSAYIPTTTAAVYGPRYDFDASTVPATPRGLLIEESRANLLTYSEQFDNAAWGKTRATVSANVISSPDGSQTADKVVEDTTATSSHFIQQSIASIAGNQSIAISMYAKAAGRNFLCIQTLDSASSFKFTYFNLSTGVVGTVAAGYTASIQNAGNGWYRCAVIATQAASAGAFYVFPTLAAVDNSTSYTGDGVSGIYLWGAQLEAGSFATSYIPTTSASVTRAADVAQLTGSALTTLQGTNWTFMGEVGRIPSASVTAGVIGANSFGVNAVRFNGSATDILTWQNNGSTYNFVTPVSALTNNTRIGLSGNASGTSSVASNGAVVNGGTVSWAVGAYLGYGASAGGSPLNSTYRSLAIYNQRLPDAILKQKSSPNAPY